jgi:hypothetical protein
MLLQLSLPAAATGGGGGGGGDNYGSKLCSFMF